MMEVRLKEWDVFHKSGRYLGTVRAYNRDAAEFFAERDHNAKFGTYWVIATRSIPITKEQADGSPQSNHR